MKSIKPLTVSLIVFMSLVCVRGQDIPLSEHPRPDWHRADWLNLNGLWDFRFDSLDEGIRAQWSDGNTDFPQQITVPFPWGSPLSGIADEADVGWYRRSITIPQSWSGKRIFLTLGASDWHTTVWLDGHRLGSHEGGYIPFTFELSDVARPGETHTLVCRVDDVRRMHTLYGKQGYGNARGIWQTVYLEARADTYLETAHCTPDIDAGTVDITCYLPTEAQADVPLEITVADDQQSLVGSTEIKAGLKKVTLKLAIPDARWWTLDDPHLYDVTLRAGEDEVRTYFGMRKISVTHLPGTSFPYIALNNEPIYLQMALDQSYHPEGFYTFPSDRFMREEIQRSLDIGLNGIRTHIKIDIPRKLYWADKLGLLVMADLPNSWGEPNRAMQEESTYTLREMIERDYNHPSIFSWVIFNETWGLMSTVSSEDQPERRYLPATQRWVTSMYHLTKSLDPSRLVEDNSICCGRGHTVTDINSWHSYLPGYAWEDHLAKIDRSSYYGSTFHYEEGYVQGSEPNINSECGNVWGYQGSTGDVDWSFDYHRMINAFRMHPKIGGWLYTEHHDVINEWNGYWRYDRSEKFTGLEDLVPGMSLRDLHSPYYISTGNEISETVRVGAQVSLPLFASFMTGDLGDQTALHLEATLVGHNEWGEVRRWWQDLRAIQGRPWMQSSLPPLSIPMPAEPGLATLQLVLKDADGLILHRNCHHFVVEGERATGDSRSVSVSPTAYDQASWSVKHWSVLDKKVNGCGSGYFDLRFRLPADIRQAEWSQATFVAELGAKELFAKDRDPGETGQINYMLGGKIEPSKNPNAYPMTDEVKFPSAVKIVVGGMTIDTHILPDDPADHRGVLSWHHQPRDGKLREAGSYGYLVKVRLPADRWRKAQEKGEVVVRLQVDGTGGLAIYGKDFGRYPVNPSIVAER